MTMHRRALLASLPLALAIAPRGGLRAQDPAAGFPARTVRIVVPYGPGGASDIVVRLLAQHASARTGQSFVVENRGGGASVPGTQAVVAAPPDGYTIGSADNALSVNPGILKERMPFDVERDLAPLGVMVEAPLTLVAHPSAPARSAAEFVAAVRAAPGRIAVAHGGTGAPTHLALLQMRFALDLEIAMVGYRGGGPQLAGMVAGDTPYGLIAVPSGLSTMQSGRLRPLAVTGSARSVALPEVPSFAEAGFPAVDQVGWWALIAPAAVPAPILDRLNAILVVEAARDPAVREKLESQGYRAVGSTRAEFGQRLSREVGHWREVFSRPGVAAD
jgi:tripartite-type tricarboxylate transporter receptor subunit TctC